MTSKRGWRSALEVLAERQILLVGLLGPVFLLADRLPAEVVAPAVLVIPALWCIHRLARGRFFTPTPVDVPLLILMATLPVGVWAAALPARALPPLLQYLFAVALFYALVNSLTSRRKVRLAGRATLVGTACLAGLGLAGTAWGGGSKFLPVDIGEFLPPLIGRVWYSGGFHPNIVGGSLAVFVPVTAAYAWAAGSWRRRLVLGLLFLVETGTLVLTQSRGALMGFAVALAVVAIARDRRWVWAVLALAVLLAGTVAVYGVQPSLDWMMRSTGETTVSSTEGRLELFSAGLYMLQDFSFTGVGLGMFSRVLPFLYPLFLAGPAADVPHVHNIYLQVGIDHGFPGLIAYLALVLLLAGMGVQAIRLSRGGAWEPLAIGLLAGLAAYLVHGVVDAIWHTPRSHPILWAHFGLLTALWCWVKRRPVTDRRG
jgi:putative inorganic carbon (HCO3(-)) transporter